MRVFFVTAIWSILAYVWLYFIVVANTKELIEPWEALLTLLFFPILTVWAWVADKRILVYDYVYKKYQKKGNMIKEYEGEELKDGVDDIMDSDLDDREKLLQVLRKIRKEHPDASAEELEQLANAEMLRKWVFLLVLNNWNKTKLKGTQITCFLPYPSHPQHDWRWWYYQGQGW